VAKRRVSKEPEIRKQEIIDAAQELFFNQGFGETSIGDIARGVGVTQGLVYYYFKSKDEILDAVVDQFATQYYSGLSTIANAPGMDAAAKLNAVLEMMLTISPGREKIFDYVHDKRNELVHVRVEQMVFEKIIGVFVGIVEQGRIERVFVVDYPHATVTILISGLQQYLRGMSRFSDTYEERVRIGLQVLEKGLGAAEGSIRIRTCGA